MRYADIERDLERVQTEGKQRARAELTDCEIVWYLLRPLHVMALALERIADRYAGAPKNR